MTAVAAPPVHDLLLALAGRLDDDLLAWARELLAVGEEGQAVELATAALAAERVVLPATLRAALVAAARGAYADLDVDRALPPPAERTGTPHRFDPAAAPGDAVVRALAALPARRIAGCTLHLTWRCTPAGTAPGPLPRAVVLVAADPERSADVLSYLLATELERAGAPASVEVFTAGATLPAYHAAALRGAREVTPEGAGRHGPTEATPLLLVPVPDADDDPLPQAPPPAEVAAEEPAPLPSGRRRRPEPEPVPVPDEPPPADEAPDPLGDPLTDPLNDPLNGPLLAPLLDPRGPDAEDARPRVPEPTRPEPARPERPDAPRHGARGADAEPARPEPQPSVPAPTAPAEVPAEWEEDWRSGEWAMPRRRPDAAPADDAFDAFGTPQARAVEPDAAEGAERTGRMPATGSLFDSPTARVEQRAPDTGHHRAGPPPERRRPPDGDALFGPRPADVPLFGDGADDHQAGRRRRPDEVPEPSPEPSALLGGTERDLLAQLHDELATRERRPRPYRRAGSRNGSARAVNGHGPDGERPPPDLAG